MTCRYCQIAVDTVEDVVTLLTVFSQLVRELSAFDRQARYSYSAAEFAARLREVLDELQLTYERLQELDAENRRRQRR